MRTMISDLPRDLIGEIVSRVPLKSMRAVRLTCKKWNTLSKRKSFLRMHIGKEAREGKSWMIVIINNNLHLVSLVVDENPSSEIKGCLGEQVNISQVFNCEGLLLCILKDDTKVVVWNSFLGQTRWIKPRYSHQGQNGWYMYALGYVNKNKSYPSHKIFRCFHDHISYPPTNIHAPENRFVWYEIYDVDSDSWRTLHDTVGCYVRFYYNGVSLKGNTYFCASKLSSKGVEDHIICFDFTRERFGPLMRLPFSPEVHDYVALSCVREEKLAVSLTHNILDT